MKKIAIFLMMVGMGFSAAASHISGGHIYYEYIGDSSGIPNQYKVYLDLLVDNSGVSAPSTATICIESSCFASMNVTASVVTGGMPHPIQSNCLSPFPNFNNCGGPGFVTVQNHIYQATVTLPGTCPDFVFSYNSCCYSNAIINVNQPQNKSIYIEARLNNTLGNNDNVQFCGPFAKAFCVVPPGGYPFNQYFGGVESDGDSILYRLSQPKTVSGFCGSLSPSLVPYSAGRSVKNPFATSSGFKVDSAGGFVTFSPSQPAVPLLSFEAIEFRYDTTAQQWIEVGNSVRTHIVPIVQSCNISGNQRNRLTLPDSNSTFFKPRNVGDTSLRIIARCGFLDTTLAADGSDFRLYAPDSSIIPVVAATAAGGGAINLKLFLPFPKKGQYALVSAIGSDGNTLVNPIGNDIPANDTLLFQIVNGGIGLSENGETSFKIFPNPAENILHFEFENGAARRISIVDVSGKTVLSREVSVATGQIDIGKLEAGLYFLKAFSQNQKPQTQPFVKD